MQKQGWIAVLGAAASIVAVRSELREVPLDASGGSLPKPGDRVAVLSLPAFTLVGMGTVGRVREGGILHLRDRIRAPAGHAVDPYAMRPLPAFAADRTREALAGLAGRALQLGDHDSVRIGAVIRAQALSYGPAPSRPAHDRPRTPGRRALIAGRAASVGLRGGGR